jgi:hypothetical protein
MSKKERLEDLGIILEKLNQIIDDESQNCPWRFCDSKHQYEDFEKHYSKKESEDYSLDWFNLHCWLRWHREKLSELWCIARGDDE